MGVVRTTNMSHGRVAISLQISLRREGKLGEPLDRRWSGSGCEFTSYVRLVDAEVREDAGGEALSDHEQGEQEVLVSDRASARLANGLFRRSLRSRHDGHAAASRLLKRALAEGGLESLPYRVQVDAVPPSLPPRASAPPAVSAAVVGVRAGAVSRSTPAMLAPACAVLLVDSLLRDSEQGGDLLPAPAALARVLHLQLFDRLEQGTQRRHRTQPDLGIVAGRLHDHLGFALHPSSR
jgi:hypothetical protein